MITLTFLQGKTYKARGSTELHDAKSHEIRKLVAQALVGENADKTYNIQVCTQADADSGSTIPDKTFILNKWYPADTSLLRDKTFYQRRTKQITNGIRDVSDKYKVVPDFSLNDEHTELRTGLRTYRWFKIATAAELAAEEDAAAEGDAASSGGGGPFGVQEVESNSSFAKLRL